MKLRKLLGAFLALTMLTAILPVNISVQAAGTGKITTTIDRTVKTVTFTKGSKTVVIDATQYYNEMNTNSAKTKTIETTFDEADLGEYTITTEAYMPATFELSSKISDEAVSAVTVESGSDIALSVTGSVKTTAPTTDYTKVKNNTIIWDTGILSSGFKPATLQYMDEIGGKPTVYLAGAISGANASDDADVYIIADTSASGAKLHSWGRGNWMQVNDGTKFKIPAMKDTKITVTSYGSMSGTADEKSFTAEKTYEYYYVGADNGLSELNFTNAGGYIGYIKTEPITRKTVTLTVTGETAGTLKFTDDASGDVVYASVTDKNVALLPGQTYSISYGTLEDSTFTPSEDKHVTNETKSFTVGDSTTTAAVTIEGGAAAKTGKLTATLDSQVKKVTLTKGETVKEITLSGVTTFEEADFGTYTVSTEAYAPATYTLTPSVESVAITADCDLELEVTSAINTTAPTTNYNTVKGNTIIWDSAKYSAGFKPASFKYLKDIQGVNNVYIAGAVLGENSSADADVYMIADTTNGKLNSANRNDWIQVNGGTKFKIPAAKDAKITITCYKDTGMAGTSDGKEFTSGQTYQYYHFAEADGLSELVLTTSGDYVGYIMSEPMPRKTVAVTVTGGTDGDCVKFTNAVTGDVQYGTIAEGAASVSLLQGFTYAVDYGTKDGETFTASETKALETNSKSLAVSSSTDTATLTVKTLDPSTKHTITIDPSITHGTITTTPAAKADEDDEVTITATRDENYKLKAGSVKVTKTGGNSTEVEVTDGKFIMPAYDVTVTAEFEASTETEGQLYVNGAYTSLETDATHFKTISEAVAAAKEINPQSEQNRVVINVYPGDYEEQVRMDQMKYVTLQQTPETNGKVNLSWYFCTNYYTSNTDLNGQYDPKIDWSLDETWNGYNEGDEEFTKYTIGQDLSGVSKISYYDTDGVKHKDVAKNSMLDRLGGLAWSYDKMAPLIVTSSSNDITIKDLNLINSTVVMKTKGQDDGHLTPNPSGNLPDHKALSICDETTALVKPTADIYSTKDGSVDLDKYKAYVASQGEGFKFTPGESAWLLQSSGFNERGHAIAILGDRIICENVRVRGNQDSVWVSDGRTYFKNCDLIGGTDYIYGSASAVFDHCKLGFVGFTDKTYGSPLATPNTPGSRKYGYLFFNCTIYNVRENNGANNFGGPWGVDGQSTFYNTMLDDSATVGKSAAKIEDKGWGRFGAENGLSRLYEFGTTNNSGAAVDLSKRIVNLPEAEGGPGMGTVLDKWQILEFNPRNVFSTKNDSKWSADWDPMNFASQLADTDAALNSTTVSVPAGNTSEITLPTPTDNNIEFHWESNSTNAIVSEDGTKLTVVRPALGESSIDSSVILYARNKTTGYGDKKEIPVTIAATTDTENVFNIPVTITASVAPEAAVDYAVTIKKGGALIKSQTITMPANSRTVTATIENIPASASGIDYDLKIVPTTDEYSIKTPENGAKTVTGVTGEDVALSVEATKLIDQKTSLSTISYANTSGTQSYDLIALAKAAGADDDIEASDIITIEYDFVPASADAAGYIDLRSNTASSRNTNADNKRFVLERVNSSWHQLDTADCTQGFSGSSNSTHQWLNIAGKYEKGADITTTAHVTTTINYKTQTITQSAIGSGTSKNNSTDPFTFEGFPEASKGSMYLYLYSDGGSWGVQNVSVTYKQLVVQKYTVTITGGEGIEDVKLGTLTGTKSGNTYTFTDVPEGTYDFDVTYTTGYEKADASPASITVSDDKTAETISAKLTEVTPPAPTQVFLDLLQGQNIRIEKKAGADANSVELEVSLAEGLTDVPVPELSAYVAVYDGTALKSVNIVPFTNNKATITKPTVSGTESYKVFIWENGNSSPVIAPITAETTGNNKLF